MLNRKNPRLADYDYSQQGGYFVTLCTHKKRCTLSRIVPGTAIEPVKIRLTELGQIASDMVSEIETRYAITVPCFVVMPNHIHLLVMKDEKAGNTPLGQIIGGYKSLITKRWRELCNSRGVIMGDVWQRNYYDHILRNDDDYLEKAQYILTNPDRWCKDELRCTEL